MFFESILILGLIALAIISFKRIDFGLAAIILSLPLYLIHLKIFFIPTTVLELMIYVVFLVWIIKKVKSQRLKVKSRIFKFFPTPEGDTMSCRLHRFLKSNFSFPILLILLGCIISIIVSPNKQIGLGILKGWFIDPLLLFLILINVIKTKKEIVKILSFLAVSGIIVAVVSIFYYFFNELTYDGRLKAFFLSPNHLAMYLAPAGIIALGLFLNLKKYFYLFGFVICSIAIFLTYSYGAWLGFGAALLFLFFFSFARNNGRKKILLLIIIGLFLSTIFFSQYNAEKFQNLTYFSRSSFESRIMIWKASAAILKDHPILGIGPGNFQIFYLDYQKKFPPYLEWAVPQPHNLFLAFYLQCGLLGLIGFIWLIFLFFKTTKRYLPIADLPAGRQGYRLPIAALAAVMIYILIHGLIDTPYWKNDLSIVFWIIIVLMFKFRSTFN